MQRGRKPGAPHLRAVSDAPGKAPVRKPKLNRRTKPLRPIRKLSAREARLWKRIADAAWWLGAADVTKLDALVQLIAIRIESPELLNGHMIAQERLLASELALDPGQRIRLGITDDDETDPADGFFK